jgi:hypothetical protein
MTQDGKGLKETFPDFSSKRCGFLVDGQSLESQSRGEKIEFDCDCLDKADQDIVWGFVLSEARNGSQFREPVANSPLVQQRTNPRVKVVMHRQTNPLPTHSARKAPKAVILIVVHDRIATFGG